MTSSRRNSLGARKRGAGVALSPVAVRWTATARLSVGWSFRSISPLATLRSDESNTLVVR